MAMKCKAGDIAIVTADEPGCEANIGRLVRVHGPVGFSRALWLPTWLIEPLSGAPWACCRHDGAVFLVHGEPNGFDDDMEHPDHWLMPVCRDADGMATHSRTERIAGSEIGR